MINISQSLVVSYGQVTNNCSVMAVRLIQVHALISNCYSHCYHILEPSHCQLTSCQWCQHDL